MTRRVVWMASLLWAMAAALGSCGSASAKNDNSSTQNTDSTMTENLNAAPADTTSAKVQVETTLGTFTVLLYGDTPLHRDNFVKLVNEGYYNGTLFHRIIDQFMIQAGDPASKDAKPGQRLGAGGPGYTIEAEIQFPRHFHKRGALAAARQGDQVNPQKRSSGSQFYVVTGRRYLPAQLEGMQQQLRGQQLQATFNGLAAQHIDEIRRMQAAGDSAGLKALQDTLIRQTEAIVDAEPLRLTPEMEKAYTEVGGAPHLDGAYTVFGEVIDGMDVIDKIEKVETDASDRPVEDVRIISMKVLK